jgi:hypothetical protein
MCSAIPQSEPQEAKSALRANCQVEKVLIFAYEDAIFGKSHPMQGVVG